MRKKERKKKVNKEGKKERKYGKKQRKNNEERKVKLFYHYDTGIANGTTRG